MSLDAGVRTQALSFKTCFAFLFPPHRPSRSRGTSTWESPEKTRELRKRIACVSIAKKGTRTDEEREREHAPAFRLGQRFRAGVEGSISFLKRVLGLGRCMNKGWLHYAATVGATVFAHNLIVLARGGG